MSAGSCGNALGAERNEHMLDRAQQGTALLVTAHPQVGQRQVNLLPASAQQTGGERGQRFLAREILVGVFPRRSRRPVAAEHVGLGQGLVEAFPPRRAADIEPELVVDRAIAHQKRVGGGKQDGILGLALPAPGVLGRHDAVAHHAPVFEAEGRRCRGCRLRHHLAELGGGLDQVGGDLAHVEPVMETVARSVRAPRRRAVTESGRAGSRPGLMTLRRRERRRCGVGAACVRGEPLAQHFIAPAEQEGEALLHRRVELLEGAQDRPACPRVR